VTRRSAKPQPSHVPRLLTSPGFLGLSIHGVWLSALTPRAKMIIKTLAEPREPEKASLMFTPRAGKDGA
jgi:hypothetical protein